MINNQVFKEDEYLFRVIYNDRNQNIYFIGLDGYEREVPKRRSYNSFIKGIEEGRIKRTRDPYQGSRKDDNISESQKAKGEAYYQAINYYWRNPVTKFQFFRRKGRAEILSNIAQELNISVDQTRRILAKFFRRGMNKDSVLPDFNQRGRHQEQGKIKNKTHVGTAINSIMRENFRKAYDKYRLKKGLTLNETYRYLLHDYYPKAIETGDVRLAPSQDQFFNWIRKHRSKYEEDQKRMSEKEFENNQRILSSYSTRDVFTVGDRFEMDCTKLDISLVSSVNRDIVVGKPFLFSIVDVYSSMCCGYVLSFENESWATAGRALYNCIEDKVEYCSSHGITIDSSDWPAHYLPAALLSDNGAVNSHNIEPMARNYGLAIEYTKPYAASQKGKSERSHRKFNDWIMNHLPGGILSDSGERGAPDYAKDACLTLEELNQIIILKILEFNKTPISKYPLSAEILAYDIEPTPLNLWNWSIQNNGGTLITVEDRELFKTLVLPHETRVIQRDGIHLHNLVYSSTDPRILALLYNRKNQKILVYYDSFDIRRIYIELENTIYPLTLKDPKTFENRMTVFELNVLLDKKNKLKKSNTIRHNREALDSDNQIARIIESARNKKVKLKDTSININERRAEIKRSHLEDSEPEERKSYYHPTVDLANRWDEIRKATMREMEKNNEF